MSAGHCVRARGDQEEGAAEEEADPEDVRGRGGRVPLPMVEEWPGVLRHASFHRQFITLTRGHAALIRNDTFVFGVFGRHCFKAIEGCASSWPLPAPPA